MPVRSPAYVARIREGRGATCADSRAHLSPRSSTYECERWRERITENHISTASHTLESKLNACVRHGHARSRLPQTLGTFTDAGMVVRTVCMRDERSPGRVVSCYRVPHLRVIRNRAICMQVCKDVAQTLRSA